ncbi:selenium cofactor biosynthesis protein YqeC [Fundidesulfovibrio putealis]|uniref:selenium cofactor biosynthesis protein YqeC n=1 Tax=Fundidesulfovibrio putealis TaxID=270496 RepID=UPI0004232AD6|nr:selenium cofactor biosynthesis protein YqeC [Fundidesulfovibrio putealis]
MNPVREMLLPDERVVAFVGAGGKTSLIYSLARQLSGWGQRVLVTTTTKMMPPARNFMLLTPGSRTPHYKHLTVGRALDPETGKLLGVGPDEIPGLRERFRADYVLVEADGAAGRPIKAPEAHEPVIPECSDLVVGVIGLDALGKPADATTVHRLEAFLRVTGLSEGELIGPKALAALAAHQEGLFKGAPESARRVAFHNKADLGEVAGRVFGSARQGWFLSLA